MTGSWPSSAHVESSALVSGYPAWLLARVLRRVLPAALADHSRERREEALQALDRLEVAGQRWADEQGARARLASACGSAEVPQAAQSPSWSDVVDVEEVAGLLEVTTRQVRNLAEELGGLKRGGRWTFSRAQVLAYIEGRSA